MNYTEKAKQIAVKIKNHIIGSKKWYLFGIVGIVMVLILSILLCKKTPVVQEIVPITPITEEISTPEQIPAPKKKIVTLSYTAMVKKYTGKRMQFNDQCQMSPAQVTFKSGTEIMLDNRSNTTRKIVVGGTTRTLTPYGFTTIVLTSSTFPKTLLVDCGIQQNSGTILIQK